MVHVSSERWFVRCDQQSRLTPSVGAMWHVWSSWDSLVWGWTSLREQQSNRCQVVLRYLQRYNLNPVCLNFSHEIIISNNLHFLDLNKLQPSKIKPYQLLHIFHQTKNLSCLLLSFDTNWWYLVCAADSLEAAFVSICCSQFNSLQQEKTLFFSTRHEYQIWHIWFSELIRCTGETLEIRLSRQTLPDSRLENKNNSYCSFNVNEAI